jgi:dihydropyrimidinase
VHVSCEQAVDPIRRARENGWDVWGETCPQYLFSDASALDRPHFEGAKYVFTPPPRTKKDQEHLWAALESDVLSVVATDHGPFRWSDQKSRGRSDFSLIPNGAPGIEHRLQVLYTLGVEAQRFSITRLAQVLAETPARLFGLYPRKGTIQVGSDADLLVLDPTRRTQITASGQHSAVDYSLYEGLSTIDGPELVTVRGNIVVRGGTLASDKSGEFVQRAPFGSELRSAPESAWAVRQSGSTSDER